MCHTVLYVVRFIFNAASVVRTRTAFLIRFKGSFPVYFNIIFYWSLALLFWTHKKTNTDTSFSNNPKDYQFQPSYLELKIIQDRRLTQFINAFTRVPVMINRHLKSKSRFI